MPDVLGMNSISFGIDNEFLQGTVPNADEGFPYKRLAFVLSIILSHVKWVSGLLENVTKFIKMLAEIVLRV